MFKNLITKRYLALILSFAMLLGAMTPGIAMAEVVQDMGITASSDQQAEITTLNLKKVNNPQTLELDNYVASMTEKRTLHAAFKLPEGVDVKSLSWTYDGKPLSQWKKYQDRGYNGAPFITVDNVKVKDGEVTASVTFDLPYDTVNLSAPRLQYPSLIGTFELAAVANGHVIAHAPVKLTPYDSFRSYDELKPEIDAITAGAAQKNDRYIKTTSIGKSAEGRDIYFTVLAKDQATVDKYQNVTHPAMMNDPKQLQADITSGTFGDYKVPIWINNIHPDESPGVDAILNYFKTMALDKSITYDTTLPNGQRTKVTLNMDDVLENVFFLFVYTDNPDGRVHNTRHNAEGFDLNRDNSYQTQPETRIVTEQIAKWSPLSFLDMHGFDPNFLIEPATPPHDPNLEYDLLIEHMLEQAAAMGEAGIANTKYDYYHIPYEEHLKSVKDANYVSKGTASGWDDASAAYTAVFAMHHGAMGHTLEIPELNEDSAKALYYAAAGATAYVSGKKEELFMNQLKIYERGVDNIDDRAVDKYLVNAKNETIGRPRQDNQNFFPEYYVLPIDKSVQKNVLETYRMVEYLLRNGVKIERSTGAVTVADTTYPAGSFVVNMHQAKRGIANLVLYDGMDVSDFESMAGEIIQNFHDMRGFERYAVREAGVFTNKTSPITSVSVPATQMPNNSVYVLIQNTNNDAIKAVNELLAAGKTVTMLTKSGSGYEAGDFVVAYSDLSPLASKYYLDASEFGNTGPSGKVLKPATVAALGETAYVLKGLGFKVTTRQSNADVLVNTFGSSRYVEEGKPYIAFGYFGLSNIQNWIPGFSFEGPKQWERYEGVFLANVMQDNLITAAYDEQEYFYTVTGSYIRTVPKMAKVLAVTSDRDDFFKAGWWPGHEAAKGKIIAFTYHENNKNLTVFSNDFINNDHPRHQYRLLANSIFNAITDKNDADQAPLVPGSGIVPKFSDLQGAEAWAGDNVREMAALGIIKGVSEHQFAPMKQVTRAEFLAMIVRALDLSDNQATVSFTDVQPSDWYYPYVAAGVKANLVRGVDRNRFEPNRAITREEMAIMAANSLKLTRNASTGNIGATLAKFTDRGNIALYAREAIAQLTEEGVLQGLTGTTYGPKDIANRAQAAVIISRMMHLGK
ncbi:S-layer homology domain-containing protein [Paenibacillus profundus]|uniref:S-layer homology domain-containing protein n=1 Tax=Paenibacillus profundus TaxID=1173085 RepID=A0ABS8YQM8_9BACL|nr:S-layer homology domain-containing protein [Paenibacillus profundus]MCE5173474.1 S-layer homology domain-containing protein [Paenibacillus profundus]